jgi:Flp pilus assembly pilin Flp
MTNLFVRINLWLLSLRDEERGQDLIEYAMLSGLIAATIAGIVALAAYSGAITAMATGIGNCVDFNGGTVCDPF